MRCEWRMCMTGREKCFYHLFAWGRLQVFGEILCVFRRSQFSVSYFECCAWHNTVFVSRKYCQTHREVLLFTGRIWTWLALKSLSSLTWSETWACNRCMYSMVFGCRRFPRRRCVAAQSTTGAPPFRVADCCFSTGRRKHQQTNPPGIGGFSFLFCGGFGESFCSPWPLGADGAGGGVLSTFKSTLQWLKFRYFLFGSVFIECLVAAAVLVTRNKAVNKRRPFPSKSLLSGWGGGVTANKQTKNK